MRSYTYLYSQVIYIKVIVLVVLQFTTYLSESSAQPIKKYSKLLLETSKIYESHKIEFVAKDGCFEDKMNEIRAPATPSSSSVEIDCSVELQPADKITKKLIFLGSDASNVVFNGNGAQIGSNTKGDINYNEEMIQVRSKKVDDETWDRPQRVFIKDCRVFGSIRIYGMGRNGEAPDVRASSRRERQNSRHVSRVRNAAPRYITLDGLHVTGLGRNTIYFGPGVTFCQLINSEVDGKSAKVGIYLDAESAYNEIINNYLHVSTAKDNWGKIPGVNNRGWPQMAIDGSSGNKIINNRFSALNNGGIYLYRNCGEGGTIRITPPEKNIIINNSFYYKKYTGPKPAVYIGSRNYGWKENTFGHCDADDGWPFGSSKSDKDFARHNIIVQNQFYHHRKSSFVQSRPQLRPANVNDMIVTKNTSLNSPNTIRYNEMVSNRINRKAACYLENAYKPILFDGESSEVVIRDGQLICSPNVFYCDNGKIRASESNCSLRTIPFDCKVEGNNRGCKRTIRCPRGMKLVGAKVACNLEHGEVPDNTLEHMKINEIQVTRASDDRSDGSCYFENIRIRSGKKSMDVLFDQIRYTAGCKEHDKNGGDCHLKGLLFCTND